MCVCVENYKKITTGKRGLNYFITFKAIFFSSNRPLCFFELNFIIIWLFILGLLHLTFFYLNKQMEQNNEKKRKLRKNTEKPTRKTLQKERQKKTLGIFVFVKLISGAFRKLLFLF